MGASHQTLRVLLRRLPYPEPHRLMRIWETFPVGDEHWEGSVSVPNLEDWRDQSGAFEAIGAYTSGSYSFEAGDTPIRLRGTAISPEVLPLLGVELLHGRAFAPADAKPGANPVVVLSHGPGRVSQRVSGTKVAIPLAPCSMTYSPCL